MPSLDSKAKSPSIKMLFIGNSGAGKTGALTALVKDGYILRIVDMDNGLDALEQHVKAECPERLSSIGYMTFRDSYKMGPTGPVVRGAPKALTGAINALDKWEDGTKPEEWDENHILVLDSLTHFSRSAFAWAKHMAPTAKEPRQWYGTAQGVIEDTIGTLTAPAFRPNVIVISHVDIREQKDGTVQGFVSSIGEALGPKIPTYFNTLLLSEKTGMGANVKRRIKTLPTAIVDVKTPGAVLLPEYPIESGLSTIFKTLRGI